VVIDVVNEKYDMTDDARLIILEKYEINDVGLSFLIFYIYS